MITKDVRSEVLSQIRQVAEEQDKQLKPLTDNLRLLDSGLDSLCFAILVVRLESTLDVDPFGDSEEAQFPLTIGDFIRCYEDAAK